MGEGTFDSKSTGSMLFKVSAHLGLVFLMVDLVEGLVVLVVATPIASIGRRVGVGLLDAHSTHSHWIHELVWIHAIRLELVHHSSKWIPAHHHGWVLLLHEEGVLIKHLVWLHLLL